MTARRKEAHTRKKWSPEEKAAIVTASYDPRSTVSGVAKKYGVSAVSLYLWRKEYGPRDGNEEATWQARSDRAGDNTIFEAAHPRGVRKTGSSEVTYSSKAPPDVDRRLSELEAELAELRSELSYQKRQKSLLIEFIKSISSQLKLISEAEEPFPPQAGLPRGF